MRLGTFDFPVTLAIAALAIFVTALSLLVGEGAVAPLLAEREAIFRGESLRLLSGPFVHGTWGHLVRDLVVVCVIGVGYEKVLRPVLPALVVFSLAVPPLVVLTLEPSHSGFIGLSGMSHAWIAAALAYELRVRPRGQRWILALVLASFAVKLVYEQTSGPSVIPTSLGAGAIPAPLAHAAGAICGAVVVFLARFSSRSSRRPSRPDDRGPDRR